MQVLTTTCDNGSNNDTMLDEINNAFGSWDACKQKLVDAGKGRFGSGWSWLVDDGGKLAVTDSPNQDSPLMNGQFPLLGINSYLITRS